MWSTSGRTRRSVLVTAAILSTLIAGCSSGKEPLPEGSYVSSSPVATASTPTPSASTATSSPASSMPPAVDAALATLAIKQRDLRESETSRNSLALINTAMKQARSALAQVRERAYGTDKSCVAVSQGVGAVSTARGTVASHARSANAANGQRVALANAVTAAATAVEAAAKAAKVPLTRIPIAADAVKDAQARAAEARTQAADADAVAAKANSAAGSLLATAQGIAAQAC